MATICVKINNRVVPLSQLTTEQQENIKKAFANLLQEAILRQMQLYKDKSQGA